jgi:hypothetical protein
MRNRRETLGQRVSRNRRSDARHIPGLIARSKILSTDSTSSSGGACRTMITDPIRQIAHPILPKSPKVSLRKYDPKTAPMRTARAPNGVTRIAGANAYAAKLNISPITTTSSQSYAPNTLVTCEGMRILVAMPAHQVGFRKYVKPSPSKPCFSADIVSPCKLPVSDCSYGASARGMQVKRGARAGGRGASQAT